MNVVINFLCSLRRSGLGAVHVPIKRCFDCHVTILRKINQSGSTFFIYHEQVIIMESYENLKNEILQKTALLMHVKWKGMGSESCWLQKFIPLKTPPMSVSKFLMWQLHVVALKIYLYLMILQKEVIIQHLISCAEGVKNRPLFCNMKLDYETVIFDVNM